VTELRKTTRPEWPDRLSGWTLPPPAARAAGEVEPVRVFDTAEAALRFLLLAPRETSAQGGADFASRPLPKNEVNATVMANPCRSISASIPN
jgi:hypothetical protein